MKPKDVLAPGEVCSHQTQFVSNQPRGGKRLNAVVKNRIQFWSLKMDMFILRRTEKFSENTSVASRSFPGRSLMTRWATWAESFWVLVQSCWPATSWVSQTWNQLFSWTPLQQPSLWFHLSLQTLNSKGSPQSLTSYRLSWKFVEFTPKSSCIHVKGPVFF